jgi:hypothetical protein
MCHETQWQQVNVSTTAASRFVSSRLIASCSTLTRTRDGIEERETFSHPGPRTGEDVSSIDRNRRKRGVEVYQSPPASTLKTTEHKAKSQKGVRKRVVKPSSIVRFLNCQTLR